MIIMRWVYRFEWWALEKFFPKRYAKRIAGINRIIKEHYQDQMRNDLNRSNLIIEKINQQRKRR